MLRERTSEEIEWGEAYDLLTNGNLAASSAENNRELIVSSFLGSNSGIAGIAISYKATTPRCLTIATKGNAPTHPDLNREMDANDRSITSIVLMGYPNESPRKVQLNDGVRDFELNKNEVKFWKATAALIAASQGRS